MGARAAADVVLYAVLPGCVYLAWQATRLYDWLTGAG